MMVLVLFRDQLFFYMQKPAKNKAKKKNIETGILMGQNTNVFSQLSATFLQHKDSNTQEEAQFLKNTNIIQYHDHNINRLINLLRKKAEATKIKAAVELHQQISKMGPQQIEEFISTFAQLFSQVIINQPSKQIVEEFVSIASEMITNHKKIVISEISTIYPPLLISNKLSKVGGLLFNGTEDEIVHKLLVLLMKKEVKKKFNIMINIIMDCSAIQKITQPHYQRNCHALMKLLRQITRLFEKNQKIQELETQFSKFIIQAFEGFGPECIKEYFKVGGRAKAAIIELYSTIVNLSSKRPKWNLNWQDYAKTVGEHFLDKDPLVQQSLWRGCVHTWLEGLLTLQKLDAKEGQQGRMLNTFLPKSEQKLLSAIELGGFSIYKELPHFCQIFPSTVFSSEDIHKQRINKLTFIRKLMTTLLIQEDQHQTRMSCYAQLSKYLILQIRKIPLTKDQKKDKEIQSLVNKFTKEIFENLEEKYYNQPPLSKNMISYFIPHNFTNLINTLSPNFEFKFNPEHTYNLYQGLLSSEQNKAIIDFIFNNSKGSQSLTLKYLETFPRRDVPLDMSEANPQVENAAKIFLLVKQTPKQKQTWIKDNWDIRKQLIAFDPRITLRDLEVEEEDQPSQLYNLYFRPSNKNLPPRYDNSSLDRFRFNYFYQCLSDADSSQYIRYFLPFINDILLPRNKDLTNELFALFAQKCSLAEKGKWTVGAHEVLVIRVLSQLLSQVIIKQRGIKEFNVQKVEICLESFCQFIRLLFAYKMEKQADDILRRAQALLVVEDVRPFLFTSCRKTVRKACSLLLGGKLEGPQKIRKNKVNKCLQLINKLLWFCLPHSKGKLPLELSIEFIGQESNWKEAVARPQPWLLADTIMVNVHNYELNVIVETMLNNFKEHLLQIACILSTDWLLPLQALPQIRQCFSQLKTLLQTQILKLDNEKLQSLLKHLVQRIMKEEQLTLSEGIRGLISYLLIENEQNCTSILNTLSDPIVYEPYEQFVKKSKNIHHFLIYNTIVSAIPLRRVEVSDYICGQLAGQLMQTQGLQFLSLLSVSCLLWNKGVGSAEALEDDSALLKKVVARAFQAYQHPSVISSPITHNFGSYSIFNLINVALGIGGKNAICDQEVAIDKLFWQKLQKGSQLQGLTLCVKMRYASRAVLSASPKPLKSFIRDLPELIKMQLNFYKKLLQNIEEEQQLPHHQSIISFFIQSAEFLLRATSYINIETIPSEKTLLELVGCPFPALRKAAFLMLKGMYEHKFVTREIPQIFKAALSIELKGEELNNDLYKEASSYLYTWQLLLLRREAIERRPEGEQELGISLQDIIQTAGLSQLFIRNCFFILDDKLDYLKNQIGYPISSQELLQKFEQTDFLEQSELSQRIFKLTMRTVFHFISNFPIFMREFMSKFKKYRNICERLLRNVLTDAIFDEQVGKIELLEPQWKADGNFQVYVTPNNKQIYAQYTHQAIRIGLRMLMRNTYPLIPIVVEFGQGLKMEESSRWVLMLQSQLQSRNTSVIKAILLWKENIDKKLSGVEQCSICFDIVNGNGQLPKKACKTCTKKFHGNCIMKWFSKSNKSECPLCKSQFL